MVLGCCKTRDGMELTAVFHGSLEVVCLLAKGEGGDGGVGEGPGDGVVKEVLLRIAEAVIRERVLDAVSFFGGGTPEQGLHDDHAGAGAGAGGEGEEDDDDDGDGGGGGGGVGGGGCAQALARILGLERCLVGEVGDAATEGSDTHHAGS